MCGSMVDIQSPTAEIRRGIKKRKKKKQTNHIQDKNIMSASARQGGHNKSCDTTDSSLERQRTLPSGLLVLGAL